VAVRQDGDALVVALSDPSRTQPVARVSLAGVAASAVVSSDPGVSVVSTSPLTLEFTLDGHGHSKKAVLR